MSKEIPSQHDLFTGELVDNRTRNQKKHDWERRQPKPVEMFSQRELAQFGVKANPKLPISPKTRLELALMDMRTEEEKTQYLQLEAERQTYPMPGVEKGLEAFDTSEVLNGG